MSVEQIHETSRLSDRDYQFIYSHTPRLCVDLVIRDDSNAILLTKRTIEPFLGYWHLVGGGVRYKESITEAANRLVFDELHTEIIIGKFLGFFEILNDGEFKHSVSLVFEARLKDQSQIKLNTDASEAQFFDVIPLDTIPVHKEFLVKL